MIIEMIIEMIECLSYSTVQKDIDPVIKIDQNRCQSVIHKSFCPLWLFVYILYTKKLLNKE